MRKGMRSVTIKVQQTLVQRGFDYTREYKFEQLFAERRKLDYTFSAKHYALAYEK
jgi:hypothetical protein